MVYIVLKGENISRAMLVKVDSREEVDERLKLEDGQAIIASFTSDEISVLNSASFAVVGG